MTNLGYSISQTNPKAAYLEHRAELDQAIDQMLESGRYILGANVTAFEAEFAQYIGVGHTIGVANGTDALVLALRACGVGPGDAVITVSHTAVATVAAIELAGATPVFADIDPLTYTIDLNQVELLLNKLASRVKATIPVHLYGHPADLVGLRALAQQHGVYLIEDCAQAHGACLHEQRVGSWGDMAAFSFYPTKNLGAFGDGGAVVTNNPKLAEQVRSLRQYGWQERYISGVPGYNSRLDELQAAVLRVKLRYLDQENQQRQAIAAQYHAALQDLELVLPDVAPAATHVYHQYVIRHAQRDALQSFLKAAGIGTLIHYPAPVHLQPAYQQRIPLLLPLPQTEAIMPKILSLPMFPQLTKTEVGYICEKIGEKVAYYSV